VRERHGVLDAGGHVQGLVQRPGPAGLHPLVHLAYERQDSQGWRKCDALIWAPLQVLDVASCPQHILESCSAEHSLCMPRSLVDLLPQGADLHPPHPRERVRVVQMDQDTVDDLCDCAQHSKSLLGKKALIMRKLADYRQGHLDGRLERGGGPARGQLPAHLGADRRLANHFRRAGHPPS